MLAKLRRVNLLSVFLAAKGTCFICGILVLCYLLFYVLLNVYLIPSGDFLGNIPAVLRGELWRVVTSSVFHYDWENHLLPNMFAIIILGPFIEWKLGKAAFVISFFICSWAGELLFCFGFGGFIQSHLGIGSYVERFNGVSMSVYGLFPLAVLALVTSKPAFSPLTKVVAFGVILYVFTTGYWPYQELSDTRIYEQIGHSCGFLVGIGCVLVFLIQRNRKKRLTHLCEPIEALRGD